MRKLTKLALVAMAVASSSMAADRADWLRGSWGLNWKPVNLYNGGQEGLSIEPFLEQISGLKTVDYLQVHLGESSIKSSVHMGPHPLLESFWEGDTDADGNPINLVVPSASYGEDPFLEVVKATRAAGLRVMVYVNSSNLLTRSGSSNPSYIPNITERWKAWCDSDPEAQAFIASQPYHTGVWDAGSGTYVNSESQYPNRKYMFCYAEFVLKDYAVRYGDLIDGWCFDSGSYMGLSGDSATNGVYEDQMIFNAFADACHAGNPNAAIAFQNSPERDTEELNPFSEAVHADDFMFGHPYNGGKDGGSHTIGDPSIYDRNYAHIEKIKETNGNVHAGELTHDWTWDDEVVGHYDPPMSTSSWNGGGTPALTDEEFNLWNLEAMQYGGAISWGVPLVSKSGTNEQLVATSWALAQLTQMDAHLAALEAPGAPNWARAMTVLSNANLGQAYSHTLVEGEDFWDSEGDSVTLSLVDAPAWLSIAEVSPGNWELSGQPTGSDTEYEFILRAADSEDASERSVSISVVEPNEIPVAYPQDVSTAEDTASPIVLSGEDADGDALSYVVKSSPSNGLLSGTSPDLVYTPSADFNGTDSFVFVANDGRADSVPATVSITVTAVSDDAPVFAGDPVVLSNAGTGIEYSDTLAGSAMDADGDSLNFAKLSGPSWLSIAADGTLSGEPLVGDAGLNSWSVEVSDGSGRTATATLEITVELLDFSQPIEGSVIINAAADTDYGIDAVATLVSPVQTFPGGLGSYQIAFDVTPMAGGNIQSGSSGGSTTSTSWGIGADKIFKGSDGESVETVDNLRVINTTGILTADSFTDFAFVSAVINNGQSTHDRVLVTLDGEAGGSDGIQMSGNPESFDLAGAQQFAIATGAPVSESYDATKNKWSVDDIEVSFVVTLTLPDEDAPTFTADPIVLSNAWTDDVYAGTLDGAATDPNGDSLSFAKLSGPSWLNIAGDGSLSGEPLPEDVGLNSWIVEVSDETGKTAEASLEIRVDLLDYSSPFEGGVVIHAAVDTDYGIDTIATMESAVQTIPGGLGTYQIAFDVKPMAGGKIQSGSSGGSTTSTSWGIGADKIFKGSDSEFVDTIDNLRVINTTGVLTPDNFSGFAFVSVEINNGQSTHDRVAVTLGDEPASTEGVKMSKNLDYIDLGLAAKFAVACGTANDMAKNKWSIDGIEVSYQFTVVLNKAPIADAQDVSTIEDTQVGITLSGSDEDGDALSFTVETGPSNGSLSGTAPNLVYTPNLDFFGTDSFTFVANDGTEDSAPATVEVEVLADTDGDGIINDLDTDDDNDGTLDVYDALPLDPTEQFDADCDLIGDNADLDDDNDGVEDAVDSCPTTPNADQADINADGYGDVCVDTGSDVSPSARLGYNPFVGAGTVIGKRAMIGDHALIGENVNIGKVATVRNNFTIADGSSLGDYSWLGNDVFIGTESEVGRFVILRDGSVLGDFVELEKYSEFGANAHIGDRSSVGSLTKAGDDFSVGEDSALDLFGNYGDGVEIGDRVETRYFTRMGSNVSVGDDVEMSLFVSIGEGTSIGSGVKIGAFARIGKNVTISDGATIRFGARIRDNTVVE